MNRGGDDQVIHEAIMMRRAKHRKCGNIFYMRGTQLPSQCPHCNEAIDMDTVNFVGQNILNIMIDPKTGEATVK